MSRIPYNPAMGSTAWKVIEFLTTNPEEFLSAQDISAKFDKPAKEVHSILAQSIEAGVLVRSEDLASGELVYRLGKGHPFILAAPGAHPALNRKDDVGGASKRPRGKRIGFIDVTKINVDKDVPLPSTNRNAYTPQTDWPALLARLAKVGDSFAVPTETRYALGKQLSAYKKANAGWDYTTRAMGDDSIRVWRTA